MSPTKGSCLPLQTFALHPRHTTSLTRSWWYFLIRWILKIQPLCQNTISTLSTKVSNSWGMKFARQQTPTNVNRPIQNLSSGLIRSSRSFPSQKNHRRPQGIFSRDRWIVPDSRTFLGSSSKCYPVATSSLLPVMAKWRGCSLSWPVRVHFVMMQY